MAWARLEPMGACSRPPEFFGLPGQGNANHAPTCQRWPDVTLNFTNQSRSYDATRHAVRFWGYDGAREVSFFVTEDALRRLQPGASADETSLLAVFEAHHDRVLGAAARVYARGRKGSYEIGANDV